MNAVEIEEAVSELAQQPFDAKEFPYSFLKAFGNKDTTIKMLRSSKSSTNTSDIQDGVLQRNNVHMAVCKEGETNAVLTSLKQSAATTKGKVKTILATDGKDFVAEDIVSGETLACAYTEFANHFGFFLSLAGISTTKEIRNNPVDIQATGRLNKLYIQLLKDNKDWDTAERRHDLNQFMSRLIFCLFAEDTSIFPEEDMFTNTVSQMSDSNSENADFVISKIFYAMDVDFKDRDKNDLPNWTLNFPYVNGGLFAGNRDVPKFSRIARTYLIHAGNLNWKTINPDIFGSMIQAVADEEERDIDGMHYTNSANILKVLNPLFLDDLRNTLKKVTNSPIKLLNLRKRIARIRLFDPACGSGNFLVIAYKEMRQIESEINKLRGESHLRSEIPLSNFRGIELREFATEIARLALIIAEYQCNELYRGQKDALADFLPLDSKNWIVHGNALRLDWLNICPSSEKTVEHIKDDLFHEPEAQEKVDFLNEGGETYICGNPPYKGSKWQSDEQKDDMLYVWRKYPSLAKTSDFVSGWISKYLEYSKEASAKCSFVMTNSICQGLQASQIWPIVFENQIEINFAYEPFKWENLAAHNAGVTVVIIGLGKKSNKFKYLYSDQVVKECRLIGPYLIPNKSEVVTQQKDPLGQQAKMLFGNMPRDGGHLFLDNEIAKDLKNDPLASQFVKKFVGSEELINGKHRFCLWIDDQHKNDVLKNKIISNRLKLVKEEREKSKAKSTKDFALMPHRFVQIAGKAENSCIVVPRVSSENRDYLPVNYLNDKYIIGDRNFSLYDAPLWNMALIASRLHWVWIGTVCVRLEMRFSYSNTLGWNTFPVPNLTEKNKMDLVRCAEEILLARETHFPATIADLYKREDMPNNLRVAHKKNDEILERIYIGRQFKNDTERLEKLFDLYTKMTSLNNKKTKMEKAS